MHSLKDQVLWCTRAQWAMSIAVAIVGGAFWLGGYRPLTSKLRAIEGQTQTKAAELRDNQQKARILPQVATEVRKLRDQLDRLKRPSSPEELPALITDLTQLGQRASLKKFSYKPDVAKRNELSSELPVTINFDGDFVNVFNFLRNAEEMQRLTRVKSMRLSCKDHTGGQVQAQLTLNIYFSAE